MHALPGVRFHPSTPAATALRVADTQSFLSDSLSPMRWVADARMSAEQLTPPSRGSSARSGCPAPYGTCRRAHPASTRWAVFPWDPSSPPSSDSPVTSFSPMQTKSVQTIASGELLSSTSARAGYARAGLAWFLWILSATACSKQVATVFSHCISLLANHAPPITPKITCSHGPEMSSRRASVAC